MTEIDDEKLVTLSLAGDQTAFEILVKRYATPIYNFVGQFIGYGTTAEDIAQESFIKVWRSLKKFDQSKRFKPWLYRIARNTAFDYLRKQKKEYSLEMLDEKEESYDYLFPDSKPNPFEHIVLAQSREAIFDFVSQLPAIYATVLKLYYLEEFSLPEIASILAESIDTIKSRHRRALLKLETLLSESKKRNF
jgi:RNA polymerase sigma-70 factor (ECF subfamily)